MEFGLNKIFDLLTDFDYSALSIGIHPRCVPVSGCFLESVSSELGRFTAYVIVLCITATTIRCHFCQPEEMNMAR